MRPTLAGAGSTAGRLSRRVVVTALAALGASLPAQDEPTPDPAVVAIRVGTLHPVDGPAVEDALVIVENGRITAIGPAASLEVPENAKLLTHPDGHAYPGLVDLRSVAFVDDGLMADGSLGAGSPIFEALDPYLEASFTTVAGGITTAYVSSRANSPWRGQGALIRPTAGGFEPFATDDAPRAVHLRMTTGAGNGHPLERQQQLARIGVEFDQLADYEKSFEDHAEKLEEYEKKFEEYLEWYREHGDEVDEEATEEAKPAKAPAERRRGPRGRGRRPRPESEDDEPPKPAPEPTDEPKPAKEGEKDDEAPKGEKAEGKKEEEKKKAPDRPQYPAPPKRDPAKDALIEVRDGERPLFLEAHRTDEIRRAIELARSLASARFVLEDATSAASMALEIARAGIPVIVTDVGPPTDSVYVPERDQNHTTVVALQAAGATVAIGSGSNRQARLLSLRAAEAIGSGLDPEVALRAITLTPAEILGVQDEIGSIEVGKRADLIITDGPLFGSATRISRVLADGETVFEEER